ncbi:MAG TPA: Gfo/Idh/MocA family oxidoreductase [Candidatus Paceibacterota bacterium]|nr:Gfo/Idh/MocA family oxidoreductase [Verrucomicrobiota bacterium]HRZ43747.1 Gfo/Idh/MocA family oxidoreductase [Candidatus Paceibacterota bacterium]HRZ91342.1 Gfo/Idh/MocA family oxidoreductase [Candidatus Paceibacterota bacterium]
MKPRLSARHEWGSVPAPIGFAGRPVSIDRSRQLCRRRFLATVAGGAGLMILPSARTAFGARANERLRLAVVGMAGYGAWHGFGESLHTLGNVRYAVSCDVDQRKVQRVYELWAKRAEEWAGSNQPEQRKAAAEYYGPLAARKPPLYADFRRMFDEAADQFDAVVVATPDHTHAIIAAAALRAGKPVFAEKPLTISAHEARALHRLARERKLPTQINTGGAASRGFRRGVELIREGLLGDVREVHMFFSRGGRNFQSPPRGRQATPQELNWDCWLAQVRWRDYHPEWINRIAWRDTSIGELGNFGPHTANMAFMALNVKDLWTRGSRGERIRVTAECSEANQLSYPRWEKIRWEVPARGPLPPVAFTWHHGYPPDYAPGSRQLLEGILRDHGVPETEFADFLPSAGCLIQGREGLLATTSHNTTVLLLPEPKFEHVDLGRLHTLPAVQNQYQEWIDACRGSQTPLARFEHAAPFAEFLAVGSLATRFPGEPIEFEPETGQITNHARAAAFLEYDYRKGYAI